MMQTQVRERIGIGVIGCGNIAQRYVQWIVDSYPDRLAVAACTDIDQRQAGETARRFGLEAEPNTASLLARDDVRIVLNLTSPAAHTAVTLAALAAGKHVYSEKPFTLSLADADRILAMASERGLYVASAPSIMFGAPMRAAWEWVRSGRLGSIHEVILQAVVAGHEAWHPNPRYYYQPGGGPMLDIGVYPLTIATTILGPIDRVWGQAGIAIPERVVASGPHAGEHFPVEVPDHITGLLHFTSGTIGTIHASFAVAKTSIPAMEMHGTAGSLWLSDKQSFDAVVRVCRRGEKDEMEWHEVNLPGPQLAPNWARAVVDLADAIDEGRPPRVSAEHAAHVLEVMLGVEQSARDGGTAVSISRRFTPPLPLDEAAPDLLKITS